MQSAKYELQREECYIDMLTTSNRIKSTEKPATRHLNQRKAPKATARNVDWSPAAANQF